MPHDDKLPVSHLEEESGGERNFEREESREDSLSNLALPAHTRYDRDGREMKGWRGGGEEMKGGGGGGF